MREHITMLIVAGAALAIGAWTGAFVVDNGRSPRAVSVTRVLVDAYDVNDTGRVVVPLTIRPDEAALRDATYDAGYRWARYMGVDDLRECWRQPPGAFRDGCSDWAHDSAAPH